MSAISQHHDTTERPMRIEFTNTRARMPAAVWRALSRSEQPTWHVNDIGAVTVQDGDEEIVVLTRRRWNQLMAYLNRLEKGASA